jgi:uncharacterized protein with von Willebrand factor type A (vWA) domain
VSAAPPRAVEPLLFGAREARLATLDRLPRTLWLPGMTNSRGALEPRLSALHGLREALRAGGLPDPAGDRWPDPPLAAAVQAILAALGLPKLCAEQRELADQVVASLLWHLDRIVDYIDRGDGADEAAARALEAFAADWQERRGALDALTEVFGATGDLLKNANWDQLTSLVASEGWQDIVRIRRLIERLPEITTLLRRLGRTQAAEELDESSQTEVRVDDDSAAPCVRELVTHVPEMPGETRGVQRSGRIARMLPSETMKLARPRLRLLWHAQRAERSLLTYEEDERMLQTVLERAPAPRPHPQRRPERRLEAGPMLLCVDTSGSMQGGAEAVAKAVVLEAMRIAHSQQRRCHVFAFGGPDEILELELALDMAGIDELARFLAQGFRGGTDICGPLERVLARLTDERWRLADLLIASDGEFGATRATAAAVDRAKRELGLRVQGVLIGDRETIGMLEVADDIFWVRDWRRYGGVNVASPLAANDLTAALFPGALRSPGRATAVGGDAAAQAVLRGERAAPA